MFNFKFSEIYKINFLICIIIKQRWWNFYLIQDKSEIFLVYLSKDKSENLQSSKIIVRPYDTSFRPFRIDSKSLVIHSKVIFLGSLEKFNNQNE